MKFIADFHIHSRYSRATSKNLDLENLYIASQIKGITVVGTGDFTHPAWWASINEKLIPAEEGLFALKPEIARYCDAQVPQRCRRPVRFVLVTEVSNIYKKNGKTRKNHNLIFMPDREAAGELIQRLDAIGNINSDGRPILGLDARNLLEIMLECGDQGYLIPAHIWTPWFSLLGSKSGFDAVEECFDDLSPYIFALETGLSSDPPMNWRVSRLDRYTLVSNSDAHSPAKLGREANLFDSPLSYPAIRKALEACDPQSFLGTVEFFPEEGKYHVDGHRKCNFRSLPSQTRDLNGVCPVCHKPLTLGVLYRVEELADRPNPVQTARSRPYQNLIPLESVLAEVFQCGSQTKKVQQAYSQLVERFGSEFDILRNVSIQELEKGGIALLAEAIARMRDNRIHFDAGFDGEFGQVRIFDAAERQALMGQQSLFEMPSGAPAVEAFFPCEPEHAGAPESCVAQVRPAASTTESDNVFILNAEQQSAVNHDRGPLMIVAGPGTGKTRTITCRMARLIGSGHVPTERILAVTFTNKAAEEMRHRLTVMLDGNHSLPLTVTFHGLCWRLLQEAYEDRQSAIVDDDVRNSIIGDAVLQVQSAGGTIRLSTAELRDYIAQAKQQMLGPEDKLSSLIPEGHAEEVGWVYKAYQDLLLLQERFDFEDLIFQTVRLMEADLDWRKELRARFTHVFVDEFQDINLGQYQLLRLLAAKDADLCVIGDPDQAIYGFRGSDVKFFNRFIEDYRKACIIRLTRNYRSSEAILESSNQVIHGHRITLHGQEALRTYSGIDGFKTISIMESPSVRAEAVAIGQSIEQMVGGTGFQAVDFGKVDQAEGQSSFDDFGILYRTSDQGRLLAEVLSQAGIPCQLVSRQDLQQQPVVAKLISALRVVTDLGCYADLNRLSDLTAPGISAQTLSIFKSWAYAKRLPLATALNTALRLPLPGLSTARQQRLAAMVRLLKTLQQTTSEKSVAEKLALIVASTTLAASAQDADLRRVMSLAENHAEDTQAFLSAMALQRDTDLYRPGVEKVALMTMHAAKGLEFNVLFVAGCEDGLIPYRRQRKTEADLQEERRLFYVAMTRARERLFLSWARKRTLYGQSEMRNLSPFVSAIESDLKAGIAAQTKPRKAVQQQLTLF